MCRFTLSALAWFLFGAVVSAQQLACEGSGPAQDRRPAKPEPQTPAAESNEITDLKAKLATLQEQVNQLSKPSSSLNAERTATTVSPIGPAVTPGSGLNDPRVVQTTPTEEARSNPEAAGGTLFGSQTRFNLSEGLVGETADGAFKYHFGGRFDWDSSWYSVPQNIQNYLGSTPLLDGTDLRRFRLATDGTVWNSVDYALEADFSRAADFKSFQSTPQTNIFITDAWIAVHDVPIVDTIRAGHQKEYLTFSNATSAKFLTFMERPYIFDAFEDDFSWDLGISFSRTYLDQHMTSWLGLFWNGTRSQAFNVGGHYAASGRLTWMPVYDEQCWLNFGISGSLRAFQENDPNSVTVRPLVRAGQSFDVPNLLNTGTILSTDGLQIGGLGVNGAWGPFTAGSEFLSWHITNAYTGSLPNPDGTLPPGAESVGNVFFWGYSAEALCFLTPGDHRDVDRITPGYARVRPVRSFRMARDGICPHCDGPGAWEIGVRYDHVDLNSGSIQGGRLDSVSFCVNWYLNPNTRVMANYVYTLLNTSNPTNNGNFDAFGLRLHFDF
jgi:phosphate-selective porin OprO/OprP